MTTLPCSGEVGNVRTVVGCGVVTPRAKDRLAVVRTEGESWDMLAIIFRCQHFRAIRGTPIVGRTLRESPG
jgi:hypothetical protein